MGQSNSYKKITKVLEKVLHSENSYVIMSARPEVFGENTQGRHLLIVNKIKEEINL